MFLDGEEEGFRHGEVVEGDAVPAVDEVRGGEASAAETRVVQAGGEVGADGALPVCTSDVEGAPGEGVAQEADELVDAREAEFDHCLFGGEFGG